MTGRRGWLRRLLPFSRSRPRTAARAGDAALARIERRATEAWEAGYEDKAVRGLLRAIARYPSDEDVAFLVGDLLFDMDRFAEAARAFDAAQRLKADDPHAAALLAGCRLHLGDVEGARAAVAESLRRDPEGPDGLYWEAVLLDLAGEGARAMQRYRAAAAGVPDEYVVPCRVPRKRFQRLAARAMRAIEREVGGFADALAERNVDLRIQDVPSPEQIADGFSPLWLGVFDGWAGPELSLESPWTAMPGRVILFQRNLERECRSADELYEQIRITLLHEVAHAHGREEDWMGPRGLA